MDRPPSPSLLPIFRSQQQAEVLTLLLGNPDLELSLTDIAHRLDIAYPSVHRDIERAETAGLVRSRRVGNTRLVRADTTSPYHAGLADVLVKAFGVPAALTEALRDIACIDTGYLYGSWAARYRGNAGQRPIADNDLLVLGEPDRDTLYERLRPVEERLGRPIQVTIRPNDWLSKGTGSFHDTVTAGALVPIALPARSAR